MHNGAVRHSCDAGSVGRLEKPTRVPNPCAWELPRSRAEPARDLALGKGAPQLTGTQLGGRLYRLSLFRSLRVVIDRPRLTGMDRCARLLGVADRAKA